MRPEFITVGTIVNAHGIRGEVKVNPAGFDPEFIADFKTMYIAGQPVKVIAQTLQAEKIEIPGKNLSFSKNMIMNILRNEKYCGDCILRKRSRLTASPKHGK